MSNTVADIVHVSTVAFRRATVDAAGVSSGSPALLADGTVAASVSVGGVLSYRPDLCGEVVLADGLILRGIEQVWPDAAAINVADVEKADALTAPLLMLRSAGASVIRHEDLTATADQRITTGYGADVTLGSGKTQIFWERSGASRRWSCPDWGGYIPIEAAHWAGGAVRQSQWSAIDRLAAAVYTLREGVEIP